MKKLTYARRIASAVAVISAASLVVSCASGPSETGEEPEAGGDGVIAIGAIVPSSGPFSEWGITNTIALEMLEQEINDAGGIGGKTLSININDDGADPSESANLVRKLTDTDNVLAIAGPLTSSSAEVAFPIANRMSVVATSQASAKPGVAANNRPWAFRNTIDEGVLGEHTVEYWKDTYDIKTAAVIYDNKDATATSSGTVTFPALLEKNDISLLNADDLLSFSTGDVDVSAQVTKLKALNPDGVVLTADYSQSLTVLREMVNQNFTPPVVSTTQAISSAILKGAPDLPIVAPATYYVGAPEPAAQAFTENMLAALAAAGYDEIEPSMYDANIYETVKMYIAAIEENGLTGDDLENDRIAIRDYMTNLEGFPGLVGDIGFNEDGDANKKFFVLVGQAGSWEPALLCESGATDCSAF